MYNLHILPLKKGVLSTFPLPSGWNATPMIVSLGQEDDGSTLIIESNGIEEPRVSKRFSEQGHHLSLDFYSCETEIKLYCLSHHWGRGCLKQTIILTYTEFFSFIITRRKGGWKEKNISNDLHSQYTGLLILELEQSLMWGFSIEILQFCKNSIPLKIYCINLFKQSFETFSFTTVTNLA